LELTTFEDLAEDDESPGLRKPTIGVAIFDVSLAAAWSIFGFGGPSGGNLELHREIFDKLETRGTSCCFSCPRFPSHLDSRISETQRDAMRKTQIASSALSASPERSK
jgi:hypothetical protein